MSRAFTSEEYEVRDVKIEIPPEIKEEADHDLVLVYCRGRSTTDVSLPYEIGMHFLKGDEGFFQSDEFAVKWLKNAVKVDNGLAMLALAEFYLSDTKTHGYREAAGLLKRSKELGCPQAETYLDMAAVDDPSTKKAFTTFRLNAELGNTEACMKLAEGFEKQYYGKDKFKAAAVWYTRAFRKGNKEAAKRVLALYYKKKIDLTEEELKFLRT